MHGAEQSGSSYAEKERSLRMSLIVDFVLFLPDVAAAVIANSIIMMADVLKCSCEILATFFSWIAVRKIARGKTTLYDYGCGKIENFTGIIVAGVMCVCLGVVLFSAIIRIIHPEPVHQTGAGLGVIFMSFGVCANTWLWIKNYRIARKEHSPIMEAQWRLFRAKAFADAVVFATLLVSIMLREQTWTHFIDPAASLVIAGFIAFAIYSMAHDSVYDLLDKTLEENMQMLIVQELVAYFDEYKALHGMRSRRAGATVFVEVFLEFDGARAMAEVQAVIDRMKAAIEGRLKGASVSIVPTTRAVRQPGIRT